MRIINAILKRLGRPTELVECDNAREPRYDDAFAFFETESSRDAISEKGGNSAKCPTLISVH